METRNTTTVTYFILVGFTGGPELRLLLFITLLLIYVVALVGNVALVIIICMHRKLHTPMYFFLWNLSLVDAFNISNTVPLALLQLCSVHTIISRASCFTQSFFYFYIVSIVFLLLTIMSYDRFVAICNPLRYSAIMSGSFCVCLVIGCSMGSFLLILYPTILIAKLPFCGPNIINHFFCDSLEIMKLACVDTMMIKFIDIILTLTILPCCLGFTCVSYTFILSTIIKIPSTNGRHKAFSTCSSHLTIVAIIYGTAFFVEMTPLMSLPLGVYKTLQMGSSIISPLINPFIYTFRNEKVKEVLNQLIHRERQRNTCTL